MKVFDRHKNHVVPESVMQNLKLRDNVDRAKKAKVFPELQPRPG